MYAKPETSLGDLSRRLFELGVNFSGGRSTLSKLLRSPIYVKADIDVYEFYKSQGATIINDAADFIGTNGCYIHHGSENKSVNLDSVAGKTLVIAPHEGIVPSDVWLKCRYKLLGNKAVQTGRKVKNSWLMGKAKCGRCGYALKAMSTGLYCTRRLRDKSCEGVGTLNALAAENFVYNEMVIKLQEFHTLAKQEKKTGNPKITTLKVELARVEDEIGKLINALTGANEILISHANVKISELDSRKQSLVKQLAEITAAEVPTDRLLRISPILDDWDNAAMDGKREVVDSLIAKILATSENVEIVWKI
jgi:hypothetical protein